LPSSLRNTISTRRWFCTGLGAPRGGCGNQVWTRMSTIIGY
jgi:hypothetical protein